MRYSSVLSVTTIPPKLRRRLEFLVCSKWRLPARERITLPVPVILNRLATDFFVLIPFGRRIMFSFLSKRARNIGTEYARRKRYFLDFGVLKHT